MKMFNILIVEVATRQFVKTHRTPLKRVNFAIYKLCLNIHLTYLYKTYIIFMYLYNTVSFLKCSSIGSYHRAGWHKVAQTCPVFTLWPSPSSRFLTDIIPS